MNATNQGWLIARREIRERARSRGFRISVLLMLIVVVAIVLIPTMLDTTDTTKNVGITGATSQVTQQALSREGGSGDLTLRLRPFDTAAAGEKALRDQDIDVLVVEARRLEWRDKADPELQASRSGQCVTRRKRSYSSRCWTRPYRAWMSRTSADCAIEMSFMRLSPR